MSNNLSNKASLFVLAMMSMMASTGASAQAESEGSASPQVGNLGADIVVTAQRRPERLQEIPLAVTAFTETTIKNLNLNDAIAVSKYVPSMVSAHNSGLATANAYYLRGLGNTQSAATFDPPVGTYVDDIYVARQNANNYAYFDTERVEVLRGPQGTLFGRNTTGGAMSIIMRKPKEEMGAKFEVTAGSFDRVTAKTSVDLPISPSVLTKWSAFVVYDEGYLKNITTGEKLNGDKSYGFRGDVRLLPTDQLTIDLSAEFTNNAGTYFGVRTVPGASKKYGLATTPVFYEAATNMRKTSCKGDPIDTLLTTGNGLCLNSDNYAASANISYATDAGTLQGIFGWRKINQAYINSYSSGTVNKFANFVLADKIENSQHSGELKWSSEILGGKLKYVAGVYYLKETNHLASGTFQGASTATAYNLAAYVQFRQVVETAAAYLQGDYELLDGLTATVGARYTWEEKNLDFYRTDRFATTFPNITGYNSAAVLATGVPLRQTQSRVTPRVALSYKVNASTIVFASATNGFKSGGWNGTNANPVLVLPFRPERTWSYEGGFKTELFDRKLRFNGNAYLAITKDLQVTSGIIIPPTTTTSQLARNAGTLRAYGFEFETIFAPTKRLTMFANGSVGKAEYLSTVLTPGVPLASQIQTSTVPVRAPKFQIATGLTYKVPVGALDGDIGFTGAFRHNSPFFVAALNTAKTGVENFVDLNLTYDNVDGKWGAAFGVTNLTKQETLTANFISVFPGDPRRFTGRLWFNF